MKCAWQPLLGILPEWIALGVDKPERDRIQELRLRINRQPELNMGNEIRCLPGTVTRDDLNTIINTASRYSPWAAATISQGFLTAPGGHRIGLCGEAVMDHEKVTGIKNLTSLCIRVARDYPGIGASISHYPGSILLIGPPGSGKTTMLRDVLRQIGEREWVSVIDERGEIFPSDCLSGTRLDVLSGCSKETGMQIVTRSMGPSCIGVDEITSESDCSSLIRAGWCGIRIIATAHASCTEDLKRRPVYRKLWETGIFQHVVVLKRDKSWTLERMAV